MQKNCHQDKIKFSSLYIFISNLINLLLSYLLARKQAFEESIRLFILNRSQGLIYIIIQVQSQKQMYKNLLGVQIKNYQVVKFIGKGQFAHVYKAIDKNDKKFVAMKVMLKSQLMMVPKRKQLALTEIKKLKQCNNPNVIKYYESFENNQFLFIITEFCNEGDLANKLIERRKIPEKQAIVYLKQIMNGFKGLREVSASHRDFKAANVLLHNNECKIADLGSSKELYEDDETRTLIGTVLTSAPQLLQGKPYSHLVDIWSIGVVFYQMIYGDYPYDANSDIQLLKVIKKKPIKFDKIKIGENTKNFIERCLTIDTKNRMTWDQIFVHPLISDTTGFKKKTRLNASVDTSATSTSSSRNLHQKDAKQIASQIIAKFSVQDRQKIFSKIQQLYIEKKNDIIFADKFIHPHIKIFQNRVRLNHQSLLFLLYKKSYIQIRSMYVSMIEKKNIINFQEGFDEYLNSDCYKNILAQVLDSVGRMKSSCEVNKYTIKKTSLEIQNQFSLDQFASQDFDSLIKNYIHEYIKLLAKELNYEQSQQNRNSMTKTIHALKYYKNNSRPYTKQYQKIIENFNFQQEELVFKNEQL